MIARLVASLSRSPLIQEIYARGRSLPVIGPSLHRVTLSLLPPGTRVWLKVRSAREDHFWFSADPRYDSAFIKGTHEPHIQSLLADHLRPGNCFYDVGAHIGFFSLVAASLVGKAGRVVAFEPDAENLAILRENARRNGLNQVAAVEAAVWSSSGKISFRRGDMNSSHMEGRVASGCERSEPELCVDAISLDDFISPGMEPPPHLLKVDVEGGECEALCGAEKLFAGVRPKLICEVHNAANAEFVLNWLRAKSYACRWIEESEKFPRHLMAIPMDAEGR